MQVRRVKRTVTVDEADLRVARNCLPSEWQTTRDRLTDALNALGPEPCGHPSKKAVSASSWHPKSAPEFRCVLPKGHHADSLYAANKCCDKKPGDPIHCGDEHVPPADVWAES